MATSAADPLLGSPLTGVLSNHVLCATDLSPGGQHALTQAAELAEVYDARLTVAHVLELWDSRYDFLVADMREKLERQAHEKLQAELARLGKAQTVPVEVVLRRGRPVEELAKLIRESRPRVVVVGANSSADPKQTHLGGLAEELLRLCPVPLLLARPVPSPDFTRIACAAGAGAPSRHAVEWAVDLARRERLDEVAVIHAYQVPLGYLEAGLTYEVACERMLAIHREDLDRLLTPFREGPVRLRPVLEEGAAASAVARAVAREKPHLLVVGAESRSLLAGLVMGSVSARLARGVSVPVLLVKSEEHRVGLWEALKRI